MNNAIGWAMFLLLVFVLPASAVLIVADEIRKHWKRKQARRHPVSGFDVLHPSPRERE